MKHTKIVATISDIHCEVDFVRDLYNAGMNVCRLNTAHMSPEGALALIQNVRAVSDHIAILVDTKGPEVRTTGIEDKVAVTAGEKVEFRGGPGKSEKGIIYVDYVGFVHDVTVGSELLVDDGEIGFTVVEKTNEALVCTVGNSGYIKNRKSVNVPGVSINLPALTEKDKKFIHFAIEQDVEFIAHSFVRNKEDVLAVQKILDESNSKVKIIAKIENIEGVNNIDEILDYAYGIMVARGDLGIEVPAEKIPGIQRSIIKKCVQKKKPVIVATQMLHTMINNPRPTRAEVSDVATAIYWRTDAIMLSGETAYGDYPVEAVKTMSRIAKETESDKDQRNDITLPRIDSEITAYFAEASVKASQELAQTTAIMVDTLTGRTARYLSSFRARKPVYAMCHDARVMRELALSYGIFAEVVQVKKSKDKMVKTALRHMVETKQFTGKDTVVYVGGSFGVGGGTSFMEIASVEKLVEKNKMDLEA